MATNQFNPYQNSVNPAATNGNVSGATSSLTPERPAGVEQRTAPVYGAPTASAYVPGREAAVAPRLGDAARPAVRPVARPRRAFGTMQPGLARAAMTPAAGVNPDIANVAQPVNPNAGGTNFNGVPPPVNTGNVWGSWNPAAPHPDLFRQPWNQGVPPVSNGGVAGAERQPAPVSVATERQPAPVSVATERQPAPVSVATERPQAPVGAVQPQPRLTAPVVGRTPAPVVAAPGRMSTGIVRNAFRG